MVSIKTDDKNLNIKEARMAQSDCKPLLNHKKKILIISMKQNYTKQETCQFSNQNK